MDIEGYEYFALAGAKNVLQKVELLLMEFAPVYMRKGNVDPNDLLILLKDQNLFPYILQGNQLVPVSFEFLNNREKNIDLYLIKKDQNLISADVIING